MVGPEEVSSVAGTATFVAVTADFAVAAATAAAATAAEFWHALAGSTPPEALLLFGLFFFFFKPDPRVMVSGPVADFLFLLDLRSAGDAPWLGFSCSVSEKSGLRNGLCS